MAFNQSEISLSRGERVGKIFVTAGVGSSGEGLTEKIQIFFIFFRVMGIKFWRLFKSPKIKSILDLIPF